MTETALIPAGTTNTQILAMWLHGRPATTKRAYGADVARFLAFVGKGLDAITLADVQAFADTLADLAPASRARKLAAVKSLLAFAHRLGATRFDVGRAVRVPPVRNQLAERIMPESAVHRLLALTDDPRNRAMLRLLYASGIRVSELCGLRWGDLQERDGGAGQMTVHGKGAKTRHVLLPAPVWDDLQALRGDALDADPVFRSRQGSPLSPSQVWRITKAAAQRAGLPAAVSPHWLRHAAASHSLDRGAPAHLVMATLGHSSLATTGRYAHARPTDALGRYLAV